MPNDTPKRALDSMKKRAKKSLATKRAATAKVTNRREERATRRLDSAMAGLRDNLIQPLRRGEHPEGLLQTILEGSERSRLISLRSRSDYYIVLQTVYRAFLELQSLEPPKQRDMLKSLSNELNRRIPPSKKGPRVRGLDPLRILLRTLVEYPHEDRIATNAVSRDGKVINYAIANGIRPSQFVKAISGDGAGLDRWSRAKPPGRPARAVNDEPIAKLFDGHNPFDGESPESIDDELPNRSPSSPTPMGIKIAQLTRRGKTFVEFRATWQRDEPLDKAALEWAFRRLIADAS